MANQDEQKDYIVQMVKIDKDATQHKVYPITRDTNVKVIPANNVPSTVTNLHELVENFGNAAFTNINQATSTGAGLMAAADKAKLDAIEAGAQVNTITGVKGGAETEYRTGNVNITKDNIGLSNVENKSSATIRGELTQVNVTTALGYTPPKTDTTYTTATQTNNGLMSSKDKAKLDGVQSGAQVNTLTGVKGDAESSYRIGNVNITKANVGLGNVENKSSATIRGELTKTDVTTALGYTPPTTNTTYADATTTVHGLMSTDDKTKLDAIEAGAQVNTVTGIKGGAETEYRTGNVNITKDNIGLSNVENKSSAAIRGEMTKTDVTTALGYTPPTTNTTYGIATAKTAGLVKSGSGITVDTSGNVSINNNSHTHTIANVTGLQSALDSKLNTSLKGAASGLAELDNNGKVPSSQLPSYVDDVIDVAMASDLASATDKSGATITPETGKIYIDDIGDNASNKTYRWSGTTYVVISETLALGETSSTAFDGARGKVAYTHSQSTHARVDATKTEKSSTNGNIKINGTETSVYTHPSYTAHDSGLYKIANDASGHVNSVTAVTKADITGLGIPGQDTTYSDVTTSTHGLMTAADKAKLNGIATGANAYTHPTYTSHTSGFYKIANDSTGHVSGATAVTKADITALGIPGQDTTYVDMKGSTPDTNGTHGLVPAPEKGASNRYLRSDGAWVVPPDTIYNDATTSAHGLMTAAMVTKLNSISTGANAYTHPTHTAYTSGLYKITVDNLGHVTAATAVAKADITALGIPGQDTNTTYSVATSTTPGLVKSGGNVTVNSDGTMSVAYASSAGSASAVTWANISGKPSTYTPTSHTHAVSEITNLQTTINTINSSIATKSAIGHTHDSIDITHINDTDLNTLKDSTFKIYYAGGGNTVTNMPSGVEAFGMLSYRIATGFYGQELYSSNSRKYIRYYDGMNSTWTAWEQVYTSVNKPSKSDVGLSNVDNTADANKSVKYATTAGSANAVAWANVSGKPSTYYTHPSYTSHASGLYKVAVDGTGHVSAVSNVTKADITALGIPGQDTNTTYGIATSTTAGLVKSGTDITVDTSGNVSVNDNSHNHTIANVTGLQSALDSKLNTSLKGAASGLAELDSSGKIPSKQLPSYVNSVIDTNVSSDLKSATDINGNTITPETGKIYIDDIGDNASNKIYRWNGTTFVVISETLALGETSSTAFDGVRGKVAYNHSQSAHARVDATKTEKSTTNGNIKINGTETNVYTHPSYTAHTSGLYKIANDSAGHVSAVTAVTKSDITNLGIPGQDTTYSDMKGATANTAGTHGLVPAPENGSANRYLRSDGTWVVPPDTTYNDATTSAHGLMTAAMVSKLNGIASGANAYTHPSHTTYTSGLYKITVDGLGHVTAATAVTKSDITSLGIPGQDTNTTYGIATSTTAGLVKSGGNVTVNTDGTMSVSYASSAGSASAVAWTNISGKPSTYAPSSHTHAVSEITNLQNTINTINSSIATKSAIGHTHDSVDITHINDTDLNTLKDSTFKIYYAGGTNTAANKPTSVDAFGMLSYRIADGYYCQELYSSNVNSGKYIRYYDATNGVWTAWEKVYTSVNKPNKSDVGLGNVDNTADANKSVKYATTAGSANAVAWTNISGKPSTYAPSSHTHTIAQVTNLQSSLDAKINRSGDTMSGALNFANATMNKVGDDVAIGDYNQGGSLGIQGLNGTTTVSLIAQGGVWDKSAAHADISYNTSDQCFDFKFN